MVGVVGRESGQVRLEVVEHADRATLEAFVKAHTRSDATVNTDEWRAYDRLEQTGRSHPTVNHTPGQREWARDDDGDGEREVHVNTQEGIWTGVRNFLRPFRGVHKRYLSQYTAVFEWAHNFKQLSFDFLRSIMLSFTLEPT